MATVNSDTEIVNMALDRLGHQPISSIGESTKAGQLANRHYVPVRDALLRAHTWNFAVTRVELASEDVEVPFEYGYSYPLPTDFLRMVRTDVEALGCEDDYRIESTASGLRLMSDDNSKAIEYIRRVTDVTLFDALFIQLLVLMLASAMCMSLADNSALLQQLRDEIRELAPGARTADAQEGTPRTVIYDPWVQSRL